MINIEEYRQYLKNSGYYLHHVASCRQYECPVGGDSYTSTIYKGRFGTGIKIVSLPIFGGRYLRVEYWIKDSD